MPLGVGFSVSNIWVEAQKMHKAHRESIWLNTQRLQGGAGKHRGITKAMAGPHETICTHNAQKEKGSRTHASIPVRPGKCRKAGGRAAWREPPGPQAQEWTERVCPWL